MNIEELVRLEGVTIFQDDVAILENIDFSVNRSEFIYFIGKVGSGKSSLIKTLYADLPLKAGKGTIAGFELYGLKREELPFLRRKLGIVFQDFQLLNDRSVYNNLDFVLRATGWKKNREKRIDEVLDKVGLPNKKDIFPHRLSGGEFQRVAIARALLNNPDIILADEPTGNLDPETTNGIVSLLHNLAQSGRTVIMATHDHALISRFKGRVFKCEDKSIIDQGVGL